MLWPQYPEPLGVFRDISRPTYEDLLEDQVQETTKRMGEGDLQALMLEGDTWTVEP
jgi:2-oxoglutarate ferredoxin oxidoreductase subunit beta